MGSEFKPGDSRSRIKAARVARVLCETEDANHKVPK